MFDPTRVVNVLSYYGLSLRPVQHTIIESVSPELTKLPNRTNPVDCKEWFLS